MYFSLTGRSQIDKKKFVLFAFKFLQQQIYWPSIYCFITIIIILKRTNNGLIVPNKKK